MRIAIDARMMGALSTRGIGRYVQELVRALLALHTQHRFILLVRDPEASPFVSHPNVEHLRADVPWYTLAEQLRMPRLLREARADLVHVPHWNVPLMTREPVVITIHDLILLHQSGSAKASMRQPAIALAKRLGFRLVLARAAARARLIFTPSAWVAEDVQHLLSIPASRVCVTGEGITSFPAPDPSLVPAQSYLLYAGSAYPHKRLDLLFQVWRKIAERYPGHVLVIAGERDVFMRAYEEQAQHEAWPRVQFLGRVSDAALAALYARASVFVFPSSQEGFGLPPLEALSFGCPVISSDATCLPEVLPQDGVAFFRDGNADDMMRAIDASLSQTDLFKHDAVVGRAQIFDRYSWSGVAERTMDGYERAERH